MKPKFNAFRISPALFTICLGMSVAGIQLVLADTWDGGGDGVSWEDPINWNTDLAPNAVANTTSDINGAFTVDRDVVSNPGRAFVQGGAVLNVHGGVSHSDGQAGNTVRNFVGNGTNGTVNVYGANTVWDVGHVLAIAHANNGVGIVKVYDGGKYNGGRGGNSLVSGYGGEFGRGHTLSIGGNSTSTGMTGLFEISGGSMATRTGVAVANNGTFSVVGSSATSIRLGGANQDAGWFLVSANGTLKAAVDSGGITPIFVEKQTNTGTLNPTAEFQTGALLDVSFVGTPISGSWTLLEVEEADIINPTPAFEGDIVGLQFAPGVDTNVWSFTIDNSGTNGKLILTAVSSTPQLTWSGTPNGNWDLGTTANWQGPVTYTEPAEVTFDDTLTGTSTVNLTTTLSPLTLTVSNPTTNYTFSGTGKISGTTGLTKGGAGNLTLSNSGGSDFTGLVQLNAGTITLGNASALGDTGAPLELNGGTLDLGGLSVTKGTVTLTSGTINNGSLTSSSVAASAGTVNATLDGASSTLTKTSSGTLVLAGANSYDGSTTISGGTVQLGNATALGSIFGTTNLASGAILDLNGQTIAEVFSGNTGTFINSNTSTQAAITTEMVGLGNPTFDGAGDIAVDDIYHPAGVTRRTTKNGAGTLTLGGDQNNNRYGLTVNAGDVVLAKTSGEAVNRFALIMNNASSTVTLQGKGDQIGDQSDANGLHQINAGTLDLNGWDEGIASLSTTNGTEPGGIVTNSNLVTTSQLTLFPGAGFDATFPGTVSGNLNLLVAGSAKQTFSGTLSYTGFTQVNNGGQLELAGANSLLNDSADVLINGTGVLTLSHGLTDVVDELFIDGVAQSPGTYGAVGSSATNQSASFAGTGILSVTNGPAAAGYASWASTNGATADLDADHDNDGVANGVEYFIGGPSGNTTGFTTVPGVVSSGSTRSVTWTKAASYAGTYGGNFVVETSTTLAVGSWTVETVGGSVAVSGNDVTYTFPAGPVKTFARLKVTGP